MAKAQTAPGPTMGDVPDRDPDPAPDADADELHFCCICGALLGFDFEDEVDGEGPGRDICGACNRTRNDPITVGW